jgi:hypothetical protein
MYNCNVHFNHLCIYVTETQGMKEEYNFEYKFPRHYSFFNLTSKWNLCVIMVASNL